MSDTTSNPRPLPCPHCGGYHSTTCHRVRVIEYNPDGTVKRVELYEPVQRKFVDD